MNLQDATGTAQADAQPWPPLSVTGTTSTTTVYAKPDPIVLPKFGAWPYHYPPSFLRNGREMGAFLVGAIGASEKKCGHVTLPVEQEAGAIHALVDGGFAVQAYSSSDGTRTFEVRSIHHEFVEPQE